jgi:hypothetical protein
MNHQPTGKVTKLRHQHSPNKHLCCYASATRIIIARFLAVTTAMSNKFRSTATELNHRKVCRLRMDCLYARAVPPSLYSSLPSQTSRPRLPMSEISSGLVPNTLSLNAKQQHNETSSIITISTQKIAKGMPSTLADMTVYGISRRATVKSHTPGVRQVRRKQPSKTRYRVIYYRRARHAAGLHSVQMHKLITCKFKRWACLCV